ncbi:MAG: NAD-binding protein, partial [Planctomycetota bacterium]|jgi:CheY-like chemotaxis protein/voltage-gated potassium channel Kch
MKNHYIICGFGRIGFSICEVLHEKRYPFVVIEADEKRVTLAEEKGYKTIHGNATADDTLREAGIDDAAGLAAVLSSDSDDLFISLAARELNPRLMIISRGEEPGADKKILRAGADIVVSPIKLGGLQIAQILTQEGSAEAAAPDVILQSQNVSGLTLLEYRNDRDEPMTVEEAIKETNAACATALRRADGKLLVKPLSNVKFAPEDTLVLMVEESHATLNEPTAAARSIDPSEKKILIVDDHRALRTLFARKITSVGYKTFQAENGLEAVTKAQKTHPDLIVLDAMMPGQTGYEACAALRKLPDFAKTPIIIYSADDPATLEQKGMASGATACVVKTSKSAELLGKIEELLKEAQ